MAEITDNDIKSFINQYGDDNLNVLIVNTPPSKYELYNIYIFINLLVQIERTKRPALNNFMIKIRDSLSKQIRSIRQGQKTIVISYSGGNFVFINDGFLKQLLLILNKLIGINTINDVEIKLNNRNTELVGLNINEKSLTIKVNITKPTNKNALLQPGYESLRNIMNVYNTFIAAYIDQPENILNTYVENTEDILSTTSIELYEQLDTEAERTKITRIFNLDTEIEPVGLSPLEIEQPLNIYEYLDLLMNSNSQIDMRSFYEIWDSLSDIEKTSILKRFSNIQLFQLYISALLRSSANQQISLGDLKLHVEYNLKGARIEVTKTNQIILIYDETQHPFTVYFNQLYYDFIDIMNGNTGFIDINIFIYNLRSFENSYFLTYLNTFNIASLSSIRDYIINIRDITELQADIIFLNAIIIRINNRIIELRPEPIEFNNPPSLTFIERIRNFFTRTPSQEFTVQEIPINPPIENIGGNEQHAEVPPINNIIITDEERKEEDEEIIEEDEEIIVREVETLGRGIIPRSMLEASTRRAEAYDRFMNEYVVDPVRHSFPEFTIVVTESIRRIINNILDIWADIRTANNRQELINALFQINEEPVYNSIIEDFEGVPILPTFTNENYRNETFIQRELLDNIAHQVIENPEDEEAILRENITLVPFLVTELFGQAIVKPENLDFNNIPDAFEAVMNNIGENINNVVDSFTINNPQIITGPIGVVLTEGINPITKKYIALATTILFISFAGVVSYYYYLYNNAASYVGDTYSKDVYGEQDKLISIEIIKAKSMLAINTAKDLLVGLFYDLPLLVWSFLYPVGDAIVSTGVAVASEVGTYIPAFAKWATIITVSGLLTFANKKYLGIVPSTFNVGVTTLGTALSFDLIFNSDGYVKKAAVGTYKAVAAGGEIVVNTAGLLGSTLSVFPVITALGGFVGLLVLGGAGYVFYKTYKAYNGSPDSTLHIKIIDSE